MYSHFWHFVIIGTILLWTASGEPVLLQPGPGPNESRLPGSFWCQSYEVALPQVPSDQTIPSCTLDVSVCVNSTAAGSNSSRADVILVPPDEVLSRAVEADSSGGRNYSCPDLSTVELESPSDGDVLALCLLNNAPDATWASMEPQGIRCEPQDIASVDSGVNFSVFLTFNLVFPLAMIYTVLYICLQELGPNDRTPIPSKKSSEGLLSETTVKQLVVQQGVVIFNPGHPKHADNREEVFRLMAQGGVDGLKLYSLPSNSEEWDGFFLTLGGASKLDLTLDGDQQSSTLPTGSFGSLRSLALRQPVSSAAAVPLEVIHLIQTISTTAPLESLQLRCPSPGLIPHLRKLVALPTLKYVSFGPAQDKVPWDLENLLSVLRDASKSVHTIELNERVLTQEDCVAFLQDLPHLPGVNSLLMTGTSLDGRSLLVIPRLLLLHTNITTVSVSNGLTTNSEILDFLPVLEALDPKLDRSLTLVMTQDRNPYFATTVKSIHATRAKLSNINIVLEDIKHGWVARIVNGAGTVKQSSPVAIGLFLTVFVQIMLSPINLTDDPPKFVEAVYKWLNELLSATTFLDSLLPTVVVVLGVSLTAPLMYTHVQPTRLSCSVMPLVTPLEWVSARTHFTHIPKFREESVTILPLIVGSIIAISQIERLDSYVPYDVGILGFILWGVGSILLLLAPLIGSFLFLLSLVHSIGSDTSEATLNALPFTLPAGLLFLLSGPGTITVLTSLARRSSCYLFQEAVLEGEGCFDSGEALAWFAFNGLAAVFVVIVSVMLLLGSGSPVPLMYPENRQGWAPWTSFWQLLMGKHPFVPRFNVLEPNSLRFAAAFLSAKAAFAVVPVYLSTYEKLAPSILCFVSLCLLGAAMVWKPFRGRVQTVVVVLFACVVMLNAVVLVHNTLVELGAKLFLWLYGVLGLIALGSAIVLFFEYRDHQSSVNDDAPTKQHHDQILRELNLGSLVKSPVPGVDVPAPADPQQSTTDGSALSVPKPRKSTDSRSSVGNEPRKSTNSRSSAGNKSRKSKKKRRNSGGGKSRKSHKPRSKSAPSDSSGALTLEPENSSSTPHDTPPDAPVEI